MHYERNISYDIFFFFLNIAIINYIYIYHTFDKFQEIFFSSLNFFNFTIKCCK